MRKFVPFVAVAVLVAAAPVQAQSCAISNSADASVSCTVGASFSMTMPSLMSLTLSGTSVALNAPSKVGDFDSDGLASFTTAGPSLTVRSNRSYKVQVKANAATFSHTPQNGAASYAKPISDVSWTVGSGPSAQYFALTTADAEVGNGSATSSTVAATIGYKTNFDITKDQPGSYALNLTFTLVAP
jgi:hypothetical protein